MSYLPATDLPRFVGDMLEFVGFGTVDAEAVRRTAPLVLRDAERFSATLYDRFLGFPRSAKFFLRPDGRVDVERLERRKHSLTRWLRETAQASLTSEFSYYLLGVGLAHSHREHGPGGAIPAHLMVGAMSLVQTTLADVFDAELDGDDAAAAGAAWNKLMLVSLAVLLLGYVPPAPVD